MKQTTPQQESDLPKLSAPARRALAAAGVRSLKDLTRFSEKEVSQWHGVGPGTLEPLRRAMKEKGLSFK